MKSSLLVVTLSIAVACSGYAFAQQQPLTRADCAKAGMTWNDSANVCGGKAAAAKEAKPSKKKEVKKKGTTKKVKTVKKTSHGKKTVTKKTTTTAPEKKGGFFKWLSGKNKKAS